MGIGVLLVLIGALLAGVVLAAWGIRGRRINRDPVCRDCGFSLAAMQLPEMLGIAAPVLGGEGGETPWVVTCPECGGGLKREKAVQVGERKRMPVVAMAGLLLAIGAMAPVVLAAYGLLIGKSMVKHLPTGVLLMLARGDSKDVATELETRILAKSLAADQMERVVDRTVELQRDWNSPWDHAWVDVFEAAAGVGAVNPDQRARWRENATVFRAQPRVDVNSGDPLVLRIRRVEERQPKRGGVRNKIVIKSIELDGVDVTRQSGNSPTLENRAVYYTARGAWSFGASDDIFVNLPTKPHGRYPFRVVLGIEVQENGVPPEQARRTIVVSDALVVHAESDPVVVASPIGPEERTIANRFLAMSDVEFEPFGWSMEADGRVKRVTWRPKVDFFKGKLPRVPFAMTMKLVDSDGKETPIGELTTCQVESSSDGRQPAVKMEWTVPQDFIPKGPVSIVFRPTIRLAKEDFDMHEYYSEEVRFDNLPVWWSSGPYGGQRFETPEEATIALRAWEQKRRNKR